MTTIDEYTVLELVAAPNFDLHALTFEQRSVLFGLEQHGLVSTVGDEYGEDWRLTSAGAKALEADRLPPEVVTELHRQIEERLRKAYNGQGEE